MSVCDELLKAGGDVGYALLKCASPETIEASQRSGVWSVGPRTERSLRYLFQNKKYVVLIFSVSGSGHFAGWGLMRSLPDDPNAVAIANTAIAAAVAAGQTVGELGAFSHSGGGTGPTTSAGVFLAVEWMDREPVLTRTFDHILNPYNESKPIKVGRDGQEVESAAGQAFLRLCAAHKQVSLSNFSNVSNFSNRYNRSNSAGLINNRRPQTVHRGAGHAHFTNSSNDTPRKGLYGRDNGHRRNEDEGEGECQGHPPPSDKARVERLRLVMLELSPALAIYPINLANMSYEQYSHFYQKSSEELLATDHDPTAELTVSSRRALIADVVNGAHPEMGMTEEEHKALAVKLADLVALTKSESAA